MAANSSQNGVEEFTVNEHIVYPAHGVGVIKSIDNETIAGCTLELYVIDFIQEKMVLRVPTNKAEEIGMRKLSNDKIVNQSYKTLRGKQKIKRNMWSRRAQEYEAKINSGDLILVSEVVRDLFRAERKIEQSYSERQLFEAAIDRMAREIAAIHDYTHSEAISIIYKHLDEGVTSKKAQKNAEEALKLEAEEALAAEQALADAESIIEEIDADDDSDEKDDGEERAA